MRISIGRLAAFAAALSGAPHGAVARDAQTAQTGETGPVIVEMFVSQSCRSCPPAAAYLNELAERPGVVALAWHVDYWNMLASRASGPWRDPYSCSEFSDRQRRYNWRIRGRNSVFTPQAIINGAESVVGSNREAVEALIQMAKAAREGASIRISPVNNDVQIDIEGGEAHEAFLVTFHRSVSTAVEGGDNAGMAFNEFHVVATIDRLGALPGARTSFLTDMPDADMGCAVIVQEPDQGRIIAAQYCP